MIRLPNSGTYSLELVTAQNGANVVVSWSDATSSAYTGGTTATNIASATTTSICATPAASTVRDVDEINIKNTYAGSHTITVQLDVAATNVPIITAALLTDESLNYTHGSGWQCKDANGNTKAAMSAVAIGSVTGLGTGVATALAVSLGSAGAVAALGSAETFTAPQRGTITTDNDGSFDQAVTNNFKCTPTGAVALTFTNHTSGQAGLVIFINGSNYAITAAATTYIAAADLVKLSATGTYTLAYVDDGTNAYCTVTAKLTSAGA